jgi:hypothetical protein
VDSVVYLSYPPRFLVLMERGTPVQCECRWIYYRILQHGCLIWLFKANSLTVGVDRIEQKCSVLQDDGGN